MKIVFIGPGFMTIPPKGWGAVESLIDDYRNALESLGHEVFIVNTPHLEVAVGLANMFNPDLVHIQYDDYAYITPHLLCKNIALTSHYAYLESGDKWNKDYRNIFWNCVNSSANIFCLSKGIQDVYRKAGVKEHRLHITPNGVKTAAYSFNQEPKFPDRSIYLAKIDFRKRQYLIQDIENLYFAGPLEDDRFDSTNERYLGEWTRDYLTNHLTDYSNIVLLSDGEAHPLVCLEGMAAGLGLVISEYATANLDTTLPFIDVVSEETIKNPEELQKIIKKNREISNTMRNEIRQYALSNFTWEKVIEKYYIPAISAIIQGT
jgi:glycosyltransferase involved in cell wall biosynthesis